MTAFPSVLKGNSRDLHFQEVIRAFGRHDFDGRGFLLFSGGLLLLTIPEESKCGGNHYTAYKFAHPVRKKSERAKQKHGGGNE